MEQTYYCPMCGAWFDLGAERCVQCGAPLPATAPDHQEMERSAEGRALGAALSRASLVRGARIQFGSFRLLAIPVMSAILLSALVRISIMQQMSPGAGSAAVPGAGPGSLPGAGAGPGLLNTLLWHIASLFFPAFLAEQVAGSGGLFGLAIPPAGADHAGSLMLAGFGLSIMPARLVPYVALARWAFTSAVLALNLLQWTAMAGAISRSRGDMGQHTKGRMLTSVPPLLVLATLPALTSFGWRQVGLPAPLLRVVLESAASVLLVAWATAALLPRPAGISSYYLVRRGLFSTEGLCLLLLSVPLLWIARETMLLLEVVGFPWLATASAWSATFAGSAVYAAAFCLTGTVSCGWFCLLDALAQRTDLSAILASAEQAAPRREATT